MSGRELEVSPSSPDGNQGVTSEPAPGVVQTGVQTPSDSGDLLIGRLLRGTYRIIAALDEGGMGKLYRAEHQRLRRPVAVKVMARTLSANTEALARFRREAEIVSQLDHPHIVHILDFDTTEGGDPYIVMELLAGETLSRRLDQLRILPLRETVDIVQQIASALTMAHRAGVVHRDLKPDNVVLLRMQDSSIFIKLLDFGISKGSPKSTRVTGKYDILGTPDYMAPEQALSTAKADHRADQWSLACMTYEMLTGHVPFTGDTAIQILSKVVSEPPPPLTQFVPNIPNSIQDIVLRGLAKDPFQRYPSIGDFADKLARAAQLLISSEQLRLESLPKSMPNSAQRAPTLEANPRQRTTKPLRPEAEKGASPSDRAAAYTSVIPDPRALSQNPQPLASQKVKPVRARLRSPVHFEEAGVESLRGGSQRIRKPADSKQPRQPSIPDVVDAALGATLPEIKSPTHTELARSILDDVKSAVASGDNRLALVKARAALKLIQGENSQHVANLVAGVSDVILPLLLDALGGPDAAVSLRQRPSSSSTSISPTHMFLASRIVDKTTIEEILDVSHLSKAETLGILLDFRDEGLLSLDKLDPQSWRGE
jgi:serine/threonine protein kinase